MREVIVEVIRKFTPLVSRTGHRDSLFLAPGKPQHWNEFQDEYRVLILADAGAGKTFEGRTRANKIHASGKRAFFIRIESINLEFENAFEIGTHDEFATWLVSNEEAWFFLDSVDEAQLDTPRALESAIRLFGERIHSARERAHIFITSREDAWQALPDRTLIEQFLPWGPPSEDERTDDTSRESDPMLKVFRLTGLSEDQIKLFASHYSIGDVSAFVNAIRRGNLMTLAERPFDLKALISKWSADGALGGRLRVLQRMIELQLAPLSAANSPIRIDAAKARAGVQILAGAVMLTGRTVICLPDGLHTADRIDPRELLPTWPPDEIEALLRTGVFDDIVYTSVRFRHREIRELLSAEWAADLLRQPSNRARVEHLFFRESYGEKVIVPRTRPTLTWLILLNKEICSKALLLAPGIASEGGDPSELSFDVRKTMLADVVERIAIGRE